MQNIPSIISDIVVLFCNMFVYVNLIQLKKDTRGTRILAYGFCTLLLLIYFVCVYAAGLPAALSSFLCLTLPSLVFLWILSKYKGSRFFVTFCMVDTITLIVSFFSKAIPVWTGEADSVIGCVFVCLTCIAVCARAYPLFPRYREMLNCVQHGWASIMISTILIYFLLIFSAAYPAPMVERPDFFVVYAVMSIAILSFYAVLISTLWQKKKLHELNQEMEQAQRWHNIAFVDALTNMKNRLAYIERINELERVVNGKQDLHAIMIDIDDFKRINDTLGHHAGDIALQKAAERLRNVFSSDNYEIFRIGGDEFAIIASGQTEESLKLLLQKLHSETSDSDVTCTFSAGYAKVNFQQNNALENAFITADKVMYMNKASRKNSAN